MLNKVKSPPSRVRPLANAFGGKRFILFLLILNSTFFIVIAQNKMSRTLLQKTKPSQNRNTSPTIALLVKGDAAEVRQLTEKLGGQFKYSSGRISSIQIPIDKINELSKSNKIIRMGQGQGKLNLLNDQMLINNNVVAVHNGTAPLARSYEGDSVIVAILDCGIDVTHPDFKNPDGTTRIKYLWDQEINISQGESMVNDTLQPYGYGQEWSEADINNNLCNEYDGCISHGSHVAGIAAGNGLAVNQYSGIAPKADIIFVAVDLNKPSEIAIADAIDYVFKKADTLGRPCVVNISLGDNLGSHDGKDIASEFMDNKLKEKNGRSIVCSAGNYSNVPFHLGYDVATDSAFTWFSPLTNLYEVPKLAVYFQTWADTQNFQNVQFAIGADDKNTWTNIGRTSYYNVFSSYPNLSTNLLDSTNEEIVNTNGDTVGHITTYIQIDEGRYFFETLIFSDSINYLWRFITKGSGRFDLWSQTNMTGTSSMVTSGLPDAFTFPDIARYKMPDVNMTLVTSWNCSPNVISTGMYQNRSSYLDVNGDMNFISSILYEIETNSGIGPTRDGRQKPDITASGGDVLSCLAPYNKPNFFLFQIAYGGMHYKNGGTSMASPMVAGAAALYLQMKPNASYKEIICAVHQSAREDGFTGNNMPDYQWGYGKLDVYGMLNQNIICGCTDPSAINYNPSTNCDDGNCMPMIYGCTDSTASNYDSLANFDDGSCIGTGINEKNKATPLLANFPNPFKDKTALHYNLNRLNFRKAEIKITDILGKEIKSIPIPNEQGLILLNEINFSPGVYLYSLIADKKSLVTKRMVVVR